MCNVSVINLTFFETSCWVIDLLDTLGNTDPEILVGVEALWEPLVQNKRKSSNYTVQRDGSTIHSTSYFGEQSSKGQWQTMPCRMRKK